MTTASQLKAQNTELKKSSEQLEWNARNLESEIQAIKFGAEMIKENNKATRFYTGLPTFALFLTLFNLMKVHVSATQGLTRIDEFFSVLVKLRLYKKCNLTFTNEHFMQYNCKQRGVLVDVRSHEKLMDA